MGFSSGAIFFLPWILCAAFGSLGQENECLRRCSDDPSTRKSCRFQFDVGPLSPINREVEDNAVRFTSDYLGINGASPGPSIQVCLGDTVDLLVRNILPGHELAVHFRGLLFSGNVHTDGVPMVTQCPIQPYTSFRYRFRPEAPGTFLYHAHSVSQQGDGVHGSLTVRRPSDEPCRESLFHLSSRPAAPLTGPPLHHRPPTPHRLLINGQDGGTVVRLRSGADQLIRLVNANAHDCPVLFAIDGHRFRALAADGSDLKPVVASRALLFPGERLDVEVTANQSPARYRIHLNGSRDCANLSQVAYLDYQDRHDKPNESNLQVSHDNYEGRLDDLGEHNLQDNLDEHNLQDNLDEHNLQDNLDEHNLQVRHDDLERGFDCENSDLVCALDLKGRRSLIEGLSKMAPDHRIYVPFDMNEYSTMTDGMTDFRYNLYASPYYPSYLSSESGEIRVAQVNGITFKYPSSPLLSNPEKTPTDSICGLDGPSRSCAITPLFCECVQIVELPPMRNVEIVLIDEGYGGNRSLVLHFHGHRSAIVGRGSFGRPISRQELVDLDLDRGLPRNLENPPLKDTFLVPNKGYLILRVFTDNAGIWLMESRSAGPSSGVQLLFKVGHPPPVPLDFPSCGTSKGPDYVFDTS